MAKELYAKIKGRVGQITEPGNEDDGKWVYTIWLLNSKGEAIPGFDEITCGPYDTDGEAGMALREHVDTVTKAMESAIKGVSFEHLKKPIEEYDA